MQIDFDHLPAAKQRELERVVHILFENFEEATAIATAGAASRSTRAMTASCRSR